MAFDGTLKFLTAIDQSGFKSGLSKLGGVAMNATKTIATGVGNAVSSGIKLATGAVASGTAAIAALSKQALDAYADFEQLSGGVETLFGDAADAVMENAAKAFQTAGMSANQYMETATASAAAMVNSLEGDTQKAAVLTDMAVTDMADNINKMGTAAENVQNAYAGFAKGNFTMLDNLKLGYGGTKAEMERLLETATALTGVQYDISSYSDIVQAIHAIQEQMGITGTTAREASETISGSVAAMKAAWDNLLVGVADDTQDFDKLAQDFVGSVETAAGNILPRVETIGDGVVKLIGALGDDAVKLLVQALQSAPEMADAGVQLVGALLTGLTDNLPDLLAGGKLLLETLANGAINGSWELLDAANGITDGLADLLADEKLRKRLERTGKTLLSNLGAGMQRNLPILLATAQDILAWLLEAFLSEDSIAGAVQFGVSMISMLCSSLVSSVPLLLEGAVAIIMGLVSFLSDPEVLTSLLDVVLTIITTLATLLGENLSPLLTAAITIIATLGAYLGEHSAELLTAVLTIITAILNAILDNLDPLMDAAVAIITALADGLTDPEKMGALLNAVGTLLAALFEELTMPARISENTEKFVTKLLDSLKETLGGKDWAALGKSILDGIFSGLLGVDFDFYDYLDEFGDNWITGIKDIFGIHSPSKVMRDEVGKYLAQGIGVGFTEEMPTVDADALRALREMQGMLTPSSFVPAGAGSSVVNNYSYTTNNSTNSATPDGGGVRDIIIPVSIGGDVIDTVVVHAVQSANAASGGVTL